MRCPSCGASSNDFGVFLGHGQVHCLRCKADYNYRAGEIEMIRKGPWVTNDEINYLRKIGTWAIPINKDIYRRKFILFHRYKDAMKFRHNWDGLDPGKILCFILNQIKREK